MATYAQIQAYVKDKYGYSVKTCWIADVKEKCGISVKVSPRRKDPNKRKNPCPPEKMAMIKNAFGHYGMI